VMALEVDEKRPDPPHEDPDPPQVSRGFEFSPFVGFENSPPVDGHSLGSLR